MENICLKTRDLISHVSPCEVCQFFCEHVGAIYKSLQHGTANSANPGGCYRKDKTENVDQKCVDAMFTQCLHFPYVFASMSASFALTTNHFEGCRFQLNPLTEWSSGARPNFGRPSSPHVKSRRGPAKKSAELAPGDSAPGDSDADPRDPLIKPYSVVSNEAFCETCLWVWAEGHIPEVVRAEHDNAADLTFCGPCDLTGTGFASMPLAYNVGEHDCTLQAGDKLHKRVIPNLYDPEQSNTSPVDTVESRARAFYESASALAGLPWKYERHGESLESWGCGISQLYGLTGLGSSGWRVRGGGTPTREVVSKCFKSQCFDQALKQSSVVCQYNSRLGERAKTPCEVCQYLNLTGIRKHLAALVAAAVLRIMLTLSVYKL